jgi:hypothetical protein
MRARLRDEWLLWAVALGGVLLMSVIGLRDFAFTDYDVEASGAVRALTNGDIAGFLSGAPIYAGSLVLRAPFAIVTSSLGGGEVAVWRALSIPCLLAGAVLAIMLARRMRLRGATRASEILAVALLTANPIELRMLEIGHPEELLCAVFAIGALLAASSRRTLWAMVLLGLALVTKVWAVLAIGPVLLALPAPARARALKTGGAIAAVAVAALLASGALGMVVNGARQTGSIFNPWQLWWPLGDVTNLSATGLPKAGARVPPPWLTQLTHPLIASLVIPLSALWWRRHRAEARGGESLLGLLALLLLLRCVLDPWNTDYYQLPFLFALLAFECLYRRERPPVLALGATLAVWLTFVELTPRLGPDVLCVLFLAWSLPLAAWLARVAFAAPARAAAPNRAAQAAYV